MMTQRPMIPLGGTMQVVNMTTGAVEEKLSGMMMIPAKAGHCEICAARHEPDRPHNKDSLFYQMRFHGEHGRWPVWADAIAHCSEPVREAWRTELTRLGYWTEPTQIKADGTPA